MELTSTVSTAAVATQTYRGPVFRRIEETTWEELGPKGGLKKVDRPLLVRGALHHWPARERWQFERLAELRRRDGSEVQTIFQMGIAEQGQTQQEVVRPIAPYLRELAAMDRAWRAEGRHRVGLLTEERHAQLKPGERFHLDWSFMDTFTVKDKPYLSLWHILHEFPELKKDLRTRELWPGLRWDWGYTFIGGGNSVTGFHFDYPTNLFCQITGVKEFLLFPPSQNAFMSPSHKYDWGGKLSHLDITRLHEQPEEAALFAQAEGQYARVETGDALFVPHRHWHAVVSLLPSVSLALFGLSPLELFTDGLTSVGRAVLHALGLYGRGNCTCHQLPAST